MNNSTIALENFESEDVDLTSLVERKAKLVRMIEAIGRLSENPDWKLLNREFFASRIETLEKILYAEVKKFPIKESEIYKLQGKVEEAKRQDLGELLEKFKVELQNIKL